MDERGGLAQRLREHLQRPPSLPDGAADRVVSAVRARLEDGPRGSALLPVLAGVVSGSVLAAVLGAALWSRIAPSPAPPGATPPPAPAVAPVLAPRPAAGSGFLPEDVAFGDDHRGWEVGTACAAGPGCVLAVRSTADGGRTWTPELRPVTASGPGDGSARIAFTGAQTGFVAFHGLYVSRDGGGTWTDTGLPTDVVAVTPVGASVWAFEGCSGTPPCPVRMLVSADAGRSWAPAPAQPPLAGSVPTVVRVSGLDAFVAAAGPAPAGTSRLAVTHDGGASWRPLADPCAPGLLGGAPSLAALEATEVWVACEAPEGAPASRAVYRTRDGGGRWELRSAGAAAGAPGTGGLTLDGRITALALAPVGPAYLALDTGPLLRSADGAAWSAVLSPAAVGAGGVRHVEFVDTAHGWAVTAAGRVLATLDGGRTWSTLAQ
jgi:photosystem II stability/assembly factor-like uncharacterized protein